MTHIAAIDQGTTSTRCIVFDRTGAIVGVDQLEHEQRFPRPGWVEHDPLEIWSKTQQVIAGALRAAGIEAGGLAAVGITNQRETTVIWERATGRPIANAIVWQDTRTADLCAQLGDQDRFRARTGLPIATYFAGPKMRWLLDSVPGARARAERGELAAGTIESWLIWNLTGGLHVTDVTNASRTLLMDLATLEWDSTLLGAVGVPPALLPEIRSSSEVYGVAKGLLEGVPIAGALGDQQAALVGQACFEPGEAKGTYGTGNFLLLNTGGQPVPSTHGLITGVAYRFGDAPPAYMLEGSIAVTGSLIQWLRDNLGLIESAGEVEELARSVPDNGGCVIVPAFSGLFAPHWRSDARGVIAGLTRYVTKAHIARAALESTAFQTRDVVVAMDADSGVPLRELRVDGGMVVNDLLMQIQADVLGVPVVRPRMVETTALGAASAAGLAVGFWADVAELRANVAREREWRPQITADERERACALWQKGVERTLGWV